MLTMASSETLASSHRLIFFARWVFALRPRMGWMRELPHFAPRLFSFVPPSVPRQTQRLLLAVSSPPALAFASFVQARHLHTHARRFPRGRVTRLQSSLYAAARRFASPSPARTSTFELSPPESPQRSVEYDYAGLQPIPATGLSPARNASLWAANKWTRIISTENRNPEGDSLPRRGTERRDRKPRTGNLKLSWSRGWTRMHADISQPETRNQRLIWNHT